MASPVKLAHLVFRTQQLPEMVTWWERMLEAKVVFRNDMLAFLTFDDEHHRLALVADPKASEHARRAVGLEHVAFTFASLGDLLGKYEELKSTGTSPYWCVNHGPTTSMYVRDPDGNQVELQVDNHPDSESLHEWFRSGAFARNPLGEAYDPDELLARHRAGEPEDALLAPTW
jgi:catechol-2,3-dioxygenase